MKKLNKSSNAVFQLNYHLVIVVKYRRKVFTNDKIISAVKHFIDNISKDYEVTVIDQECGEDHIHLLIQTKPSTDLCKYINVLKGHSSRMLRKEFKDELSNQQYRRNYGNSRHWRWCLYVKGNLNASIIIEQGIPLL